MAKKILVVDDKREMVMMIQAYLAQEGFQVVTAGDGREALYVAGTRSRI
jgi:DNA-binding response OmpR family regulator